MKESQDRKEEVTFMGDSAGGNIVLSLPTYVVHNNEEAPLPSRILAIAPVADCRVNNPEIQTVAPNDPWLTHDYIEDVSKLWCKDVDRSDPMVNPLLADHSPLKKRKVIVDGVFGTWDILSADDKLLAEKLRDDGLEGSWLVYEGHIHVFPLTL